MDTRDLDAILNRLRAEAEHAAARLFELERDATTSTLGVAPLTGTTAAEWSSARATLDVLVHDVAALGTVVERAATIRASGRFLSVARHQEMESLVCGASVPCGVNGETMRTPADTLSNIVSGHDDVRRVVDAVGRQWDTGVREVRRCRDRLTDVAELAARIGAQMPRGVAEIGLELDDISELLLTDPLSLDPQRLPGVARQLDDAAATLRPAERAIANWPAQLAAAHALRETLDEVLRERDVVVSDIGRRIAGIGGHADSVTTDELDRELAWVAARAQHGAWPAATDGLRTWNERANALLDEVGRATAAARAALAVRDELRGRLRAYEAMAAALGVLEDTTVADRRREAHDVLHTAPTDVVLAEHLVTRYGEALLDARKEART